MTIEQQQVEIEIAEILATTGLKGTEPALVAFAQQHAGQDFQDIRSDFEAVAKQTAQEIALASAPATEKVLAILEKIKLLPQEEQDRVMGVGLAELDKHTTWATDRVELGKRYAALDQGQEYARRVEALKKEQIADPVAFRTKWGPEPISRLRQQWREEFQVEDVPFGNALTIGQGTRSKAEAQAKSETPEGQAARIAAALAKQ